MQGSQMLWHWVIFPRLTWNSWSSCINHQRVAVVDMKHCVCLWILSLVQKLHEKSYLISCCWQQTRFCGLSLFRNCMSPSAQFLTLWVRSPLHPDSSNSHSCLWCLCHHRNHLPPSNQHHPCFLRIPLMFFGFSWPLRPSAKITAMGGFQNCKLKGE